MIYVTGDTHGDIARIFLFIEFFAPKKHDTLIICGDFGFLYSNDKHEHIILDYLESLDFTICFIDGNHDPIPLLFSFSEVLWNNGRTHQIRKNIFHLMRGQVFTIEGKTFFTMGGGYSKDRAFRKGWWSQELPSDEEYKEALDNLSNYNMKVNFVITHTAPRPMIYPLGSAGDIHEESLSNFLDYLFFELDYEHWFCGHWHEDRDINDKFTFLWYNVIRIK